MKSGETYDSNKVDCHCHGDRANYCPIHIMPKDDEDVLFFAFRYALGRRTGAVTLLVEQIKKHWLKLRPQTQKQIQDEIKEYPEKWGSLGGQCDKEAWQEVLNLTPSK